MTTIGEWIKSERRKRGWSIDQLVARSTLSKSHISEIENGRLKTMTICTAARLARAFSMPTWKMIRRMEEDGVILTQERNGFDFGPLLSVPLHGGLL